MTVLEQNVCNAIISMAKKDEPDYWTRLEHQYAGMAMQGMLSNQTVVEAITESKATMERVIPCHAYRFAHALVEKMKEAK